MKRIWGHVRTAAVCLAAVALSSGCAAFRSSVSEVDVEKGDHMRGDFDFRDLRSISQGVVDEMLGSKFLAGVTEPPTMMVAGVENRTSEYLDTKAITDTMRTRLINSQAIQFVNEQRRGDLAQEQGYQAANATPGTGVAIGQQAAARYMMSGSIVEMKQRSAR